MTPTLAEPSKPEAASVCLHTSSQHVCTAAQDSAVSTVELLVHFLPQIFHLTLSCIISYVTLKFRYAPSPPLQSTWRAGLALVQSAALWGHYRLCQYFPETDIHEEKYSCPAMRKQWFLWVSGHFKYLKIDVSLKYNVLNEWGENNLYMLLNTRGENRVLLHDYFKFQSSENLSHTKWWVQGADYSPEDGYELVQMQALYFEAVRLSIWRIWNCKRCVRVARLGKSISLVLLFCHLELPFQVSVPLWTLLFQESQRTITCIWYLWNDQWQDDKTETKQTLQEHSLSVTPASGSDSASSPPPSPTGTIISTQDTPRKGEVIKTMHETQPGAQTLACLVLQLLVSEAIGEPMCLMVTLKPGWTTGTLSSVSLNKFRSMNANFRNLQAGHLGC